MLRVEALRVAYDGKTAVDGVDLDVGEGEVVALLGPSGSGKSTILRAVAGLQPADAGQVSLDGRPLGGVAPHEREIGLMFQDFALFPHLDVGANVAFGPRMQRRSRAEVAARVNEVLGLVRLAGFERRAVASLSGGEQQRVALARALAPAPKLLLLDEPLGSLDRALREQLAVELRALFTALRATVVVVTHDQSEAFTLADRVVLLRAGQVVQAGSPAEVWRHPVDAFVARFLGFANVVPVTVTNGSVDTPWGPVPARRPDGPAVLVLRPSATPLPAGGAPGRAGAAAFRGDHFSVRVELDGGWVVEVVDRSGDVPAPATRVSLALDPGSVLLVDPDRAPQRGEGSASVEPHSGERAEGE
jgi:thiamine transport system ATP-binding protein